MTAKIKIRPSTRVSWRKCPRAFFYRWVAGVEPARTSKALIMGSAYHAGLQAWREGKVNYAALAAEEFDLLWSQANGAEPVDTTAKSQVVAYVIGYARHFGPFDRGITLCEVPVFESVAGDGGTSDCVIKNELGEVWVVEDKTTARFEGRDAMAFSLKQNDQIASYVWALRKRGIDVKGAKYRQVLKTGTKQTLKETPFDYAERIVGLYTGGDSDTKYREFIVTWTEDELARLRRASDSTNRAIRRALPLGLDDYQINPLSCIGPYGPCPYLTLCAKGRDESDPPQYKPTLEEPLDDGSYRKQIWTKTEGVPEADRTAAPLWIGDYD